MKLYCKAKLSLIMRMKMRSREKTAYNGRFGASEAVARPKVCANLEVLRPSERQWKPRLRQAAGTLHASGESAVDKAVKT